MMTDIRNYTVGELGDLFKNWRIDIYRAKQIFSWLYKEKVLSFDKMSNLSCDLREWLRKYFSIKELKLAKEQISLDGTKKFLFQLEDSNFIESVLIPSKDRITACLSTQVGCKYRCNFCASGLYGFKRNLETSEIVAQVLEINRRLKDRKVTHIVFMGTGEPLDNYESLLAAIRIINSKEGLNIGARRITISTSGVIPAIEKLSKEGLQIELSVSLHASCESVRSKLMPVNKKFPLGELIAASKRYALVTGRQVTFEYALIKDVNCSFDAAEKLIKLLKGWNAKVNLIPYNPISEFSYRAPSRNEALGFKRQLERARITVTVRKPRGEDIQGACGQLRLRELSP